MCKRDIRLFPSISIEVLVHFYAPDLSARKKCDYAISECPRFLEMNVVTKFIRFCLSKWNSYLFSQSHFENYSRLLASSTALSVRRSRSGSLATHSRNLAQTLVFSDRTLHSWPRWRARSTSVTRSSGLEPITTRAKVRWGKYYPRKFEYYAFERHPENMALCRKLCLCFCIMLHFIIQFKEIPQK